MAMTMASAQIYSSTLAIKGLTAVVDAEGEEDQSLFSIIEEDLHIVTEVAIPFIPVSNLDSSYPEHRSLLILDPIDDLIKPPSFRVS